MGTYKALKLDVGTLAEDEFLAVFLAEYLGGHLQQANPRSDRIAREMHPVIVVIGIQPRAAFETTIDNLGRDDLEKIIDQFHCWRL